MPEEFINHPDWTNNENYSPLLEKLLSTLELWNDIETKEALQKNQETLFDYIESLQFLSSHQCNTAITELQKLEIFGSWQLPGLIEKNKDK